MRLVTLTFILLIALRCFYPQSASDRVQFARKNGHNPNFQMHCYAERFALQSKEASYRAFHAITLIDLKAIADLEQEILMSPDNLWMLAHPNGHQKEYSTTLLKFLTL